MTDVLSRSLTLAPSPWLRRHRMQWRDRNDRPVGRDRDSRRLILPSLKDSKSSIKIQLLIFKKYLTCTQFYIVHLAALCPIEKAGFRLSRRRCAAAESWKAVLPRALPSLPLSERWCDGPMAVAPLLGREEDSTKRPCEQKEYYGSLIM